MIRYTQAVANYGIVVVGPAVTNTPWWVWLMKSHAISQAPSQSEKR